jgi:YHS domain-containing protein
MNKLSLIALMSVALVGGAFAQGQTPKPTAQAPKEIACAVMPSNKVDIADATKRKMFADYKGNRYYFCCGGCPGAFKADPAKYAKAAHTPTPKPEKKSTTPAKA